MAVRNRAAFTLVELLVVVVIISMLVALLLPAVISARESARRAQCTNNQSQLCKALQQYDTAKQHFPGYVNIFGTNSTRMSWVVVCMPYLGREDIWKTWRDNTGDVVPRVNQLVCPSDAAKTQNAPQLSYVANCGDGTVHSTNPEAYGVFFDHTGARNTWTMVSASNIPDGAQSTLLIGENLQAYQWNQTTIPQIGMVWQSNPGNCSRINRCLDDTTVDLAHARPSCRHGGGAVVSFCDGHQYFLSEEISYQVYQYLMTPDGNVIGQTATIGDGDY